MGGEEGGGPIDPRRARPEPARQARLARRLLQVLVAERAPRRQAHQYRPRPLPGGDPSDGPRPGAGQRPRHRRGPRPAPALRRYRTDVRRSVRDGHRDPRGELEARRQDRGEPAHDAARLRAAPARRDARRRDRRHRRHGRAAAHLVHQAQYRAQRAPAQRRGDEVGRRPGPPPRQPRGRRALGGASEQRRPRRHQRALPHAEVGVTWRACST